MLRNLGEKEKICSNSAGPKDSGITTTTRRLYLVCNNYFVLWPIVFIVSQSHSPSSNLVFGPYRSPTKSSLSLVERHSQQHQRDDNNAFVELRRGAGKILLPTVVVVVSLVRRCPVWGIRRRSKIDF